MVYTPDQYTGPGGLVHLHSHSIYSSLDGVITPSEYASACEQRKWPGIAITEHGHMASFPDFYFEFKKRKLKIIPGCEIYFNDFEPYRQQLESSGGKIGDLKVQNENLHKRVRSNRHVTVLAKNEAGFHNLIKLTTLAHQFGFYYYPRIWFDKLAEFGEGLIILSGCLNGPISHEIRLDVESNKVNGCRYQRCESETTATNYIRKFKSVWGDDFFVEVQMPCITELYDVEVFKYSLKLADEHHVKAVLTNDCHYLTMEDSYLQRIMSAVSQKTTVFDHNLFTSDSNQQFLKTRAELWATFKNGGYSRGIDDRKFEEICDNTLLVAERCEQPKPDTSPKIPDWSAVEPGKNADDELRRIVCEELRRRGWDKDQTKWLVDGREVTYAEQAEIELNRFIDKGFASYFLITRDLIQYGKERGWPFGPRGCTIPGSLVTVGAGDKRKNIEDIQIGDKILDGFGNYQIVENKFIYDISEELYVFELDDRTIEVTSDHKLYVVSDGKAMLMKAGAISATSCLIGSLRDKPNNHEDNLSPQVRNVVELQRLVSAGSVERLRIRRISTRLYTGKVYDLQVGSTNSYRLNGVFSSNSAGGSIVCYLLGVHSILPPKWGLSFDRFMASSRGGYLLKVTM